MTTRDRDHVARQSTHHVVVVVYDGVNGLDVTGPYEVFGGARDLLAFRYPNRERYEVELVSLDGSEVRTKSGLGLVAATDPSSTRIDTLIIAGGRGAHGALDRPEQVRRLRELVACSQRIVSVCTGAFLAAAAGVLDGRRATTHWAYGDQLRAEFPLVDVDTEPLFINEGRVWTSAGVSAGMDLSLALVELDHGTVVADEIARWMVMYLRRPGGQSQFAQPIWHPRANHEAIAEAQQLIDADPSADLRVDALAQRAAMSARNFSRVFREEVGLSPGQYVTRSRLAAARHLLETSSLTIAEIAQQCGFRSSEQLRRRFLDAHGVPPSDYRLRFGPAECAAQGA